MGKVNFWNAETNFKLRNKKEITHILKTLFRTENQSLQNVTFVFCTDEYLFNINKKFLKHNFYTDVITFDLSEIPEQTIGEIYISIDRIKDNAATLLIDEQVELHRVIIHGALHLCGYRDKKKSEITLMREKEDYYLRLFGRYLSL